MKLSTSDTAGIFVSCSLAEKSTGSMDPRQEDGDIGSVREATFDTWHTRCMSAEGRQLAYETEHVLTACAVPLLSGRATIIKQTYI